MAGAKRLIEPALKAWCNTCRGQTNHQTRLAVRRQSPAGAQIGWETVYETVECYGCDCVSFRTRHCQDDDFVSYGDEGECELVVSERRFPPKISRIVPNWIEQLDWSIKSILNEVYSALDNNLTNLAAMGARTVIDRIMADKVGEQGTFVDRLKAMEKASLITRDQGQILDAALDLGHAANHRGHYVSGQQLTTAMNIIEVLLQTLYVLPDEAEKLRQKIPPRV